MEAVKPSLAVPHIGIELMLPDNVPDITLDDVKAVIARNDDASDLYDHFVAKRDAHGVFSADDIAALLNDAHDHDTGACDGDQAVVFAYFAEVAPEVFAPDAQPLLARALGDVDWATVMIWLNDFREKLRQQEEADKREMEKKQERLEDDLKHDAKKRALIKENGTKAERAKEARKQSDKKAEEKKRLQEASPAAVDEELTASGRLKLSDVELAQLGLLKKGFANRG